MFAAASGGGFSVPERALPWRINNLRTCGLLLYGGRVNDGRTCGLLLYGGRVNDGRTCGLLLYGRHIGRLTASIGTPHILLDAAFNRTTALFFKPKTGTDVALAGLFALLAGFFSESLCVRQIVLGRSSVPILVIKVLNRSVVIVIILRRCTLHRNQ